MDAAADVLCLYGVDVSTSVWELPVNVSNELIRRLSFEERSMWRAKQLGGEQWFDWGREAQLLTHTSDGVRMILQSLGSVKKPPNDFYAPRPNTSPESENRVVTPKSVREMDWSALIPR